MYSESHYTFCESTSCILCNILSFFQHLSCRFHMEICLSSLPDLTVHYFGLSHVNFEPLLFHTAKQIFRLIVILSVLYPSLPLLPINQKASLGSAVSSTSGV